MANTFLHAQGVKVGKSLAEKDMADTARRILAKAEDASCAIILPVDAIVAFHFEANAPSHAYGLDAIPRDGMILDVGRQSIERIKGALDDAATLVWNGPLGAFEMPPFDTGTVAVARYAAERTRTHGLVSVAGGGDTVAALNAAHVADKFTYVSTAGGAFLEWLEGRKLPGVEALRATRPLVPAQAPADLDPLRGNGGDSHAGGFINPAEVSALVMIAMTSIAPSRFAPNFGSSVFRIENLNALVGNDLDIVRHQWRALGLIANDRGLAHARARLAGQAEELRDVIGRRDSGFEQKRSGRAAMRAGRERRAVRHAGDGVGLDHVDAVAAPDLARIAVDHVLDRRRIDPVHIGPLLNDRVGIHRLHGRVEIAMPDRHARPGAAMRRSAPHQIAPFLRGARPSLEHALERLLDIAPRCHTAVPR